MQSKHHYRLIRIRGRKKDRYTILSEVALNTFKEYLQKYKPEKWLFSGQRKDMHISTNAVQAIFENACKKAGTKKDVTVRSLRRSFTTTARKWCGFAVYSGAFRA